MQRIINIVYSFVLLLAFPGVVCYHLYRSVSRGRRAAFAERFGFIPDSEAVKAAGQGTIWVHAVSVGETLASRPLLTALKKRYPDKKLVISTVTETGREVAQKLREPDLCIYFPFDYRFAVRRAVRTIKPELVIVVETEIWPTFMDEVRRQGIPSLLVNGRISDRSLGRYLKLSWFFRPVLEKFTALCMQSAEDRRRIITIGAPAERVIVANNLKYDLMVAPLSAAEKGSLRERYLIPADTFVVVAGSTHQGEDESVIAACRALLDTGAKVILVLVPRHPERSGEVADLLRKSGFQGTLRSRLEERQTPLASGEALLVDRVGELMSFYSLADLIFVGGSLVPTGGHNLLEPASVGIPLLFGPHMTNFREITALVLEAEAGVQVADGGELLTLFVALFTDDVRRSRLGHNGLELMARLGGSTDRHMAVIEKLVKGGALSEVEGLM